MNAHFAGNVTFYDAVNIIHYVITTPDPFPYTAKFMFFCVRNNETQQIRRWKINRIRTYCCRISKISNSVGTNDNFLAKARKLSFLPTSLHIFDIRQHYIHILNILHTCEITFYDVIDRTVHTFTKWRLLMQKSQNLAKWVCFGPLFFNLIRLIQLCDKKNLTFVEHWDKILLNSPWKTLLRPPKARLITFSKTRLIKILSQQLNHDRSCIF